MQLSTLNLKMIISKAWTQRKATEGGLYGHNFMNNCSKDKIASYSLISVYATPKIQIREEKGKGRKKNKPDVTLLGEIY